VRAEALSATSIVVRWRLPSPPPERITVERMDRASGAFARAAVLGADAATWTAEGLVPSTFYYFRVRAEPVQATPTESDGVVGARTLDAAETRPDAPTALSATRLSGGEGLLNWIDSSRGTARVVVERGIGDGPFGEVASLAAGMRSWLDTAAPVAQRARYRLFAENGAGRKDRDGANDRASALHREGVFRVSIGVLPATYARLFGPRPARPAKGGVVETAHDFTALDVLTPHPVYAWMGWVQILSPTTASYATVRPLIEEAHRFAAEKLRARRRRSVTDEPPG